MLRLNDSTEAALHGLGWTLRYYHHSLVLYKPPKDTRMTAAMTLTETAPNRYVIDWTLNIPSQGARKHTLSHIEGFPIAHLHLEQLIFAHLEAYLSGHTNIPKKKKLYQLNHC